MLALAEQLTLTAENRPAALVVSEMVEDRWSRQRAERLIRGVGAAVLNKLADVEIVSVQTTLMDEIHAAKAGDPEALKIVNANVSTHAVEQTIKAGHVMTIKLAVDENGKTHQHGHYIESVSANALRFASAKPAIRRRSEAETRNGYRIEDVHRQGLLEDNYFVVMSRCEEMSDEELKDNGMFPETKTCVIQATTADGAGLEMQSAFVAGVVDRNAPRHDAKTVIKLGAELEVDFNGKSPAEIIDMAMLVPKSRMPNGVIDLVALYDELAGGTFFGENKPKQDYVDYLEVCKKREQDFAPTVKKIVSALLSEADTINIPVKATRRLHKLTEAFMVERATIDTTINPRVFGTTAAKHIERARVSYLQGDVVGAQLATQQAQDTAVSYACPSAYEKGGDNAFVRKLDLTKPAISLDTAMDLTGWAENLDDSCEYISEECPECGAKKVKTKAYTKDGVRHVEGSCRCHKTYTIKEAA